MTDSAFTFDTSGLVHWHKPDVNGLDTAYSTAWTDLTPFVQGYIEGVLGDDGLGLQYWNDGESDDTPAYAAFSDLHPSALALILRDCEAFRASRASHHYSDSFAGGLGFFTDRQRDLFPDFPPLAVTLDAEGRVCLTETK